MKPAVLILTAISFCVQISAQFVRAAVIADPIVIQDFEKRVAEYLKLRKSIESDLPRLKNTGSTEKITHHEDELYSAVRRARKEARPGDVFTPGISAEIRKVVAMAMQPGGPQVGRSLRSAEPVQLHLQINEKYPEGIPLQSTPPSLLQSLPALPPEIEYRVTGQDLVLVDAKANLIIDFIRGVFS